MFIVDIIRENDRIAGYRVANDRITQVMSRKKVIEAIERNRIKNAKLQYYKDGRVKIIVNKVR